MHTLLDLRGNIPSFIHVSDGKLHDVNVLDQLIPEPGAFYVMDRGYIDFARLYLLHQAAAFFVTRAKSNLDARRVYSAPTDSSDGVICDQTIVLTASMPARITPSICGASVSRCPSRQDLGVPDQQHRLAGVDDRRAVQEPLAGRTVLQMDQAAPANQALLRHNGQRRKDPSLDCRALYVLVAIVKKKLHLEPSLYTLLQILGVTFFEKMSLQQPLLTMPRPRPTPKTPTS